MNDRTSININELKEKTKKNQEQNRTEQEQSAEAKAHRIREVADEEISKLIAELPELLESAAEVGKDSIRIYTDRIYSRKDLRPVDVMELKEIVVREFTHYCWEQGLNTLQESGYPHSEDCYESWIEISW